MNLNVIGKVQPFLSFILITLENSYQKIKMRSNSYPTKKPAKCNNSTESITTPSSPDNIDWRRSIKEASEANEALTTEDLKRTTFSEKTLNGIPETKS